jgi:hypothetical protein
MPYSSSQAGRVDTYRDRIMFKSKFALALVALFLVPSICSAGFRCKPNGIVEEGDTKSEVKIMCGSPMSSSYEGEIEINEKEVNLDRWTYNPGKGKFYVILDFHDGVLAKIKNGPRVK